MHIQLLWWHRRVRHRSCDLSWHDSRGIRHRGREPSCDRLQPRHGGRCLWRV